MIKRESIMAPFYHINIRDHLLPFYLQPYPSWNHD